jgi:hypothetical protein
MYYASPVVSDEHVYILSEDGTTLVLKTPDTASGKPPAIVAQCSLAGQKHCWATPAIAEGRLFLRSGTHLYCLGLGDGTDTGLSTER